MKKKIAVIVIGPFPPPIHGMSKNLELVSNDLEAKAKVIRLDISPGSLTRDSKYFFRKFINVLKALIKILSLEKSYNYRLYMPPDAGLGIYYTIIFTLIARLYKFGIFFHHRSFYYIDEKSYAMKLLTDIAGLQAIHIFLCTKMYCLFNKKYRIKKNYLILSNAIHIKINPSQNSHNRRSITIGHLSNLGVHKGIKDIFSILRFFINKNYRMKLILAGPPENKEAMKLIKYAKKEFGNNLDYRGKIIGRSKENFFLDIDIFLFPTSYVHEALPNVILEAISYGIPTISYDRGCIGSYLGSDSVKVIPTQKRFVEYGIRLILDWINNFDKFISLRNETLIQAYQLHLVSKKNYNKFLNLITN